MSAGALSSTKGSEGLLEQTRGAHSVTQKEFIQVVLEVKVVATMSPAQGSGVQDQ